MAYTFTVDEVFIFSEMQGDEGDAYPISNNFILFESPTKVLGRSMWRGKTSTGKKCVAIFNGINVDTSSEEFEVIHEGATTESASVEKSARGCRLRNVWSSSLFFGHWTTTTTRI